MNLSPDKNGENNLFKEIFNNTLDAILITDDQGKYTDVNKAACDLTGYSKKELLKLSIWDLTPAENREEGEKIWGSFLSEGTLEGEYELLIKNKKRVITDFKAVANIQPGKHMSVLRNISGTKFLEKQREDALKKLENNLESISDGFFTLNSNMEITYFNNQAEEILGRKREDVLNKHIFNEAFPEAGGTIFEEKYTKALKEKIRLTFEVNFGIEPYKNWYSVRVFPTNEGISVYFQAITKLKEWAAKVEETNNIINKSNSVAFTWLNAPDWPIEFATRNVEKLLGYEADELISKKISFEKFIHPLDLKSVMDEVKYYTANKEINEFRHSPYRIITRDNKVKWVDDWTYKIRDDEGNITHFKGILQDITKSKITDDENKERNKELRTLYSISNIVSNQDFTLDELFQKIVHILPAGWRFPKIASACITIEDNEYKTSNYHQAQLKQSSDIFLDDSKIGEISVGYEKRTEEMEENPFLKEEDLLLKNIAERLGKVVARKNAEEALKLSEERYREAQKVAKMGDFEWEIKTNKLFWSDEIFNIFGLEKQTPTFDLLEKAIHPEDYQFWSESVQKSVETKNPLILDFRIIKPGNEIVWIHNNTKFILDENDEPLKLFGTVLDITDRKNIEMELARSTEFLNITGEMARIGGWEVVLETSRVHWSKATKMIHEVPPDYIPTLEEAIKFFPGQSKEIISEAVNRAIEKGEDYDLELEFITAKNKRLWVHTIGKTVFEDGKCKRLYGFFQDITERKAAKEAALRSKQIAENYLNIAAEIIISLDTKGDIEILNESGHRLLGYENGELIGKNWFDTCLPVNAVGEINNIFSKIMTGEIEDVEKVEGEVKTKSGQIKTILWHNSILYEDGKLVGLLSSGEDISERKRTEKELENNAEFLKNILNSMTDGFSLLDKNGIHLDVNPAFCEMVGFSKEELIGSTPPHPYWPEEEYQNIQSAFSKTMEGQKKQLELTFKKKNEERFLVLVSASQIKDENGAVLNNFATIKDITELKEIEVKLRESEENYKNLFNHIDAILSAVPDIIMEVDKNKIYRWANQPGSEFFGDDVIGKNAEYYFEGEQETLEKVKPVFDGIEEVIYVESWQRRKDGEKRLLAWWCRTLKDADGNLRGALSSARDITEQKLAEEELQKHRYQLERLVEERTRKFNEANKELQDFVYSVSHDLRAPLRAIMGFSEIIGRRHKNDLNEEGQKYFDNIVKAGNHMVKLIEDLLQYSRIGEKPLQLTDLNDVLDDTLRDLEGELKRCSAQIKLPDVNLQINSNHTLLYQIFLNLINNAILYQKPETKPNIQIDFEEKSNEIIISIKDNGIGIEDEYKDKIFNIFQRLHNEEEYPGTGVGLAIVKKSAHLLKGLVWVTSEFGEGSTFFVRLPKIEEKKNG